MFLVVTVLALLIGQTPDSGQDLGPHNTLRFRAGGSPRALEAMTFSPDGKTLVVSLVGGNTVFIRTQDGETIGTYGDTPFALAFSKDGSRMLLVSPKGFTSLDAERHTPIPLEASAPSDGYTGLTAGERNGKLMVLSLAPNSPVAKLGSVHVGDELVGVGDGLGGPITSVIGSSQADVRKLLIGPVGTLVRLKVIPRGNTRAEIYSVRRQPIRQTVSGYEFLPIPEVGADDNVLVHMDGEQHYIFRNARTGQVIATIKPEAIRDVGQFAVSADGSRFAILARHRDDENKFAVEIFRVATGERESFVPFEGHSCLEVCFAPDGLKLLVGTNDSIEILDFDKRAFIDSLKLAPEPPASAKEERSSSRTNAALDAARERIGFIDQESRILNQFAVSPKGVVAVGETGGAVRLADWNRREVLRVIEPDEVGGKTPIESLAFSADGK
jgi:WD40 repeat protein